MKKLVLDVDVPFGEAIAAVNRCLKDVGCSEAEARDFWRHALWGESDMLKAISEALPLVEFVENGQPIH